MVVRQPVEKEYIDVFQNLESVIIQFYRQYPQMTDWDVETVIDALIRHYQALWRGREPRPPRLNNGLRQAMYEALMEMCEFRLGNEGLDNTDGEKLFIGELAITLEELVAILKRIRKSIRLWSKERGTRGYLTFVDQFFPKTAGED